MPETLVRIGWPAGLRILGGLGLPSLGPLVEVFMPPDLKGFTTIQVDILELLFTKISIMPRLFAIGILGLTLLLDLHGVIRFGKPFHSLPLNRRLRLVSLWRNSPIGMCRDLVRFYERIVAFIAYSIVFDHIRKESHKGTVGSA